MARAFSYLMGDNVEITDTAIFKDTSKTIKDALFKTHNENNSKQNISRTSMKLLKTINLKWKKIKHFLQNEYLENSYKLSYMVSWSYFRINF